MNAWLNSGFLLPIIGLTWIGYWWNAGEFSITGNVHPSVALMEQDVILSCQVGGCSPSSLEVWLYKWGHSEKNALYIHSGPKPDKIQESSTGESHENGTRRGQFKNGVLEVTLFRVQTADSGQYVCAMTCGRVHKEVTMDVIVTGIINATVGEDVILPCYLRETCELSHWKLQWRRIGPGKNQAIYSYLYQYLDTCPVLYSEDSFCKKCSHSKGPSTREWLGEKYEYKAEVSIRNSSLKLNNVKKDDAGRYQCSVRSNSFNKTIIFKLSTIVRKNEPEIHDRNMEVLKFNYCGCLYVLAIVVLLCCAAYFVRHKRRSFKVEEQKKDNEKERKQRSKVEVEMNDKEERQPRIQVEEQKNSGEELQKHEIQVEEQENDAEELQKLRKQNEELKKEAEELRKHVVQTDFLEARFHRVDVILDPSTAHPRLEVSQDGKCVRDTGSVLKVPNSEERFDSHMFVLAKDGFDNGKHYWEVEVGQKKNWDLGVASESISRKGKITLAPQNGYWVIGLDGKKDYWARTDPWTRLDVSGKPTKIGMFLNIPERNLSFYDVKRRSKLHTYTFSSSGKKLYPFFSIGSVTTDLDNYPFEIPPWFKEDVIEESERNPGSYGLQSH